MTQDQFDAVVAQREQEAQKAPQAYKLRLTLLALLGYAYIIAILGGLLLLLVGLAVVVLKTGGGFRGALKLALPIGALALIIARALRVRVPPPEGIVLTREQAPQLFATVDEYQQALKCPPVHQVLLTDDFNAGITQIPRFGIFGQTKNYLLIGLPLLIALPPEQFRAVLAHELAHIAGGHGQFGAWIYRLRKTWQQLMDALERKRHWASPLFERFFQWYIPMFMASSFVQARMHEYEADQRAAERVGADVVADTLTNLNIYGAFLSQEFWPELEQRVNEDPTPPTPYADLYQALEHGFDFEQATALATEALESKTDSADTHPSFADRLAALGQSMRVPPTTEPTAAEYYLGGMLGELTNQLDQMWVQSVAPAWRERHTHLAGSYERLRELDARGQTETLTVDEVWEWAQLVEEFEGEAAAQSLYEAILEANPNHVGATFAMGRILLAQGQEIGLDYIEGTMSQSRELILPGCQVIYEYLTEQGRHDEAAGYRKRAEEWATILAKAEAERSTVRASDTYLPHEFAEDELVQPIEQLQRHPQVSAAYLVRKQVQFLPDQPLYVLGVVTTRPWYRFGAKQDDARFVQELAKEVELPGEMYVVPLNTQNRKFKKTVEKIPEALIFTRS